jgi:hypothetical protein
MFVRLLLTAILAATLASAQRGGGGGGRGGEGGDMSGGMGGGMPRVQRQSKFELFADRLRLNKDQKDEVQTIFTDALREAAPVREQISKGREVITGAILDGKSQDDLKKMMDAYTMLAAQMTAIETKAFGKVYATLKPNQQTKAAPAFELMAGMFDPPSGGRGGARRPRN